MARPKKYENQGAQEFAEKIADVIPDADTKAILEYTLKRIESMEQSLVGFGSKLDGLVGRMDTIEAVMKGEDAGFEKALKDSNPDNAPRVLSKDESGVRGTLAGVELQEVVHKVLGSDCHAYVLSDAVLPKSFLSILIPERLSGIKNDFRSKQINNASASSDTKKWCELVKSNLFRQYAHTDKGAPEFRIKSWS